MNDKTLRVLEFDKIKERLIAYATSSLGREKIEDLVPMFNLQQIEQALGETSEARLIARLENFSLDGLADIRASLRRVAVGAMLQPRELLDVAGVCYCSRRVSRFLREKSMEYPLLATYGPQLTSCKWLEDLIYQSIDESGAIYDGASAQLRKIRNEMRTLQSRLRQRLESMVKSVDMQKYLQEPIITMRNDRHVIPVKQEYRGQVAGIIHDQSASGATLFIEPMAIVEINNALRRLELEEEQEIERILRELSGEVQVVAESLQDNLALLAYLDLVLAKGRLSYGMKAVQPLLNDAGYLHLKNARHPLLSSSSVVPITVYLGQDFTVLLITGPNTGGKTVTLKTIGLLTLMAQAGLHIPADEGSEVAVFQSVFADIGDEQSIEQNLSTFSSHMTNIIHITRQADYSSLVLLDELGAGTDPAEGAALAMSIIDYLRGLGCRLVATTHYSELKTYAYQTPGVQNASVEFDVNTLRPTYRLTMGLPGKSNAFEISRRLGLADSLIEHARTYLTGEQLRAEDLIRQLEISRADAQAEREAVAQLRREVAEKKALLDKRLQDWEREEDTIREQAKRDARSLLQTYKQEMEQAIVDLKSAIAEAENKTEQEATQMVDDVRGTWRDLLSQTAPAITDTRTAIAPENIAEDRCFQSGDEVFIKHLAQKGQLLSEPDKEGEVQVQLGALRLSCHVDQLEKLVSKPESKPTRQFIKLSRGAVPLELDLRGQTVDEAVLRIDKYLDDACIAGIKTVTLIHGKGTGALRRGVSDFISEHQHVKSYRLGGPAEGGTGVTVVELRS